MFPLRSARIFAFLVFSVALLRSAAQSNTEDPTEQQLADLDAMCQSRAQAAGEDTPTDWGWSLDNADCEDQGNPTLADTPLNSTTTDSGTSTDSGTTSDDNSLAGDVGTTVGDAADTVGAAAGTVGDAAGDVANTAGSLLGSLRRRRA